MLLERCLLSPFRLQALTDNSFAARGAQKSAIQAISSGEFDLFNSPKKQAPEDPAASPRGDSESDGAPPSPSKSANGDAKVDNSVRLWSVETGTQCGPAMEHHTGPVVCINTGIYLGDKDEEGKRQKTPYACSGSTDKRAFLYQLEGLPNPDDEDDDDEYEPGKEALDFYEPFEDVAVHGNCRKECCWKKKITEKDENGEEKVTPLAEKDWKNLKAGASSHEPNYGCVSCIDFSPDGRFIITGSNDDHVRLYSIDAPNKSGGCGKMVRAHV